jgi:hypothetical protein
VGEVERLATLREAVAIAPRELQRLHKVDIAAAAVDHLVQDYETKRQAFQAETAATKAEWDAEIDQRERREREYEEALKTKRQRESNECEYKKALERKKVQDKYDEEQRLRNRQNREKQEALEKLWQEREATLKAREDELAQLQKDTDVFPKRLAQEVDRVDAGSLDGVDVLHLDEPNSLLDARERPGPDYNDHRRRGDFEGKSKAKEGAFPAPARLGSSMHKYGDVIVPSGRSAERAWPAARAENQSWP